MQIFYMEIKLLKPRNIWDLFINALSHIHPCVWSYFLNVIWLLEYILILSLINIVSAINDNLPFEWQWIYIIYVDTCQSTFKNTFAIKKCISKKLDLRTFCNDQCNCFYKNHTFMCCFFLWVGKKKLPDNLQK